MDQTRSSGYGCNIFLLVLCVTSSSSLYAADDVTTAQIYLSKYGYLPRRTGTFAEVQSIENEVFSRALIEFQSFVGLSKTGFLDKQTLELMRKRRCAFPDRKYEGNGRSKRYILEGSKWESTDVKYCIKDYSKSSRLRKEEIKDGIAKALSSWSKVSNLVFTKLKTEKGCHIEIRFANRSHGDYEPFDGPGGLLAHGFFPEAGGDTHFDDEEDWTMSGKKGTNFIQTATHEFGHSLGLSHSDVKSALMAAYYEENNVKTELHPDDVEAIQALYGEKGGPVPTLDPDEDPFYAKPKVPAACVYRVRIDAACSASRGSSYLFMGDKVWKIGTYGIESGYPKLIKAEFPKAPVNINAAIRYNGNCIYIFKDQKVWRYYKGKIANGYPKYIKKVFKGIPDRLDGAFESGRTVYFIKGSQYWKYEPKLLFSSRRITPKSVSTWKGIPKNVTAALRHDNGYVYFFQKEYYWRLNKKRTAVGFVTIQIVQVNERVVVSLRSKEKKFKNAVVPFSPSTRGHDKIRGKNT